MQRIVRRGEAASILGISDTTLWRWTRDGRFPKPIKLGPNTVGWLHDDLEAWLASRSGAVPQLSKAA
jgi:prophage regulatory protein